MNINLIANIPITSKALATNLPKSLTFLEMYKVGNIEQLNDKMDKLIGTKFDDYIIVSLSLGPRTGL